MKPLVILAAFLLFDFAVQAQIIDPGRAAKRAIERRVNRKIEESIDKTLDKAEEEIEGKASKKGADKNGGKSNSSSGDDKSNTSGSGFSSTGKFDFISGEKVIAVEDFSQDALGDFPARWNTNGSGELVRLNNNTSKFLKLTQESVLYPEFVKNLPDNFTVEFDLSSTPEFSYYNGHLIIGFTSEPNVGAKWRTFSKYGNRKDETKSTVEVAFHPTSAGGNQGMTVIQSFSGGNETLENDDEQGAFATKSGRTNVHVSIWRQKSRIRVYIDQFKVWDIPRAFASDIKINSLYFRNDGTDKDGQAYFVSNLKVAVGAPDTRNKLITEGRFVTSGILFDVNSDKIKPESYGVLKEIGNVLAENEDVKIKIIGHTDSDGDEAANLLLSKKRAESVKKALSSQFGINSSRMTTDGKGEAEPAGPNTSVEGKANNRRVEFVKQ